MNDHPSTLGTSATVLSGLLEEARTRLIETGARNRLVHTPRNSSRSKSIAVLDANPDEVFRALVRQRTSLSFVSAPDEKHAEDTRPSSHLALPPLDEAPTPGSGKLQTRLTAEGLQKRLVGLFRDARTLEEEQGVNILFLAVGFLRWFEDERSEIVREAPLILIPVDLTRTSSRSSLRLVVRDDDITTNLPLQERLRQFGLTLPVVPDTDDWKPTHYFASVRNVIGDQPRWSIDEQGMMLGFFSFSKFLMFRDLDPANWPNGVLLNHPIIRGLLFDGFSAEAPLFPDDIRLDETFDPAELIHVVDADSYRP